MSEQNNLAKASKGQYAGRNKMFLLWLWDSSVHRGLLNDAWLVEVCKQAGVPVPAPGAVFTQAAERVMVERLGLKNAHATAPVHYVEGLCDAWLQFIHSLDVEFATQCAHRSAFGHLWSNFHGPGQVSTWKAKIASIFKGLARSKAAEKASGKRGRVERGKRALEFQTYSLLCEQGWGNVPEMSTGKIRVSSAFGNSFVVLYMTLAWNLMSRSKNVTGIAFSHLSWVNDSLTIMFCVTKTNQAGRNMHPRHVYANPLVPHMCPVLALGVYLMTKTFGEDDNMLFPGQKQYNRFSKQLGTLVKHTPQSHLEAECFRLYGTHSFRKGAATYACSGSTAAPHISAVSNRAGWKQPGVQDTYLVYADAGDQYVGRVVSGLPLNSHNFAMLPPYFPELSESVSRALELCFPSVRGRVEDKVLAFCLASIVHHSEWLRAKLPGSHAIFRAALFLEGDLLAKLVSQVKCHVPATSVMLKATGVPPHIDQLHKLERVEMTLEKMFSRIEEKFDGVVDNVLRGLDERQVESHLTPTGLKSQLRTMIDELGLGDLRSLLSGSRLGSGSQSPPDEQLRADDGALLQGFAVFTWDGLVNRLLPADFVFPRNASVRDMWFLYIVGSPSTRIRPLKDISRDHFRSADARKRACEFYQLMRLIESRVRKSGAWQNSHTVEGASEMFEVGKGCFVGLSKKSARDYHRRVEQLGWRRAHDLVVRKVELNAAGDSDDEDEIDDGENGDEGSDNLMVRFLLHVIILAYKQDKAIDQVQPGKRVERDHQNESGPPAKAQALLRACKEASDRSPDGDVAAAYTKLIKYCNEELQLEENAFVIGDGACMFRLAEIQLLLALPGFEEEFEGDELPKHQRIRYRCAQWVYQKYYDKDDDVLRNLGYEGWKDWHDKMMMGSHYGDELCLEAITDLFQVRICIIFSGYGSEGPNHRYIGNAANPLVYFALVGDHHCYSFAPISQNQLVLKKRRPNGGGK
jgi:hypothetical protein